MRRYIGLAFWVGFAVTVGLATSGATLHAAWVSQDIGSPGQAGSMSGFPPGPITIYGGGADIWGNADQFHFAYNDQPVEDFSAIVRVVSQQNTDAWAKAGIMARAELTPGSIHVHTSATPSNGITQQWRDSTGGGSGGQGLSGSPSSSAAPYWIRLDRVGNVFDSYWAPDLGGTPGTWQGMQSHTSNNMPATAYLGLSVTSHNNGALSQVVFDGLFTATRNSAATGYWDQPGTWTPAATPTTNDYLILDGSNTVTSRLAADVGGRLDIVDDGALVVQSGASLDIAGKLMGKSSNPIVLQNNAALAVGSDSVAAVETQGNSNVTVRSGSMVVGRWDAGSAAGTLMKQGAGTLRLDNSDGTGVVGAENLTVDVHEGTLYARGAQPLGGTSPTTGVPAGVVLSGGTLSVEGGPVVLSNQLNYGFYANAAASNLPNIDDGIDGNGANGGLFALTPSPQSQWPSQVRGKAVWTDEVWQAGNIGDNYCQMWWGHVNVPAGMTGDFTVYVHGDDFEIFWLDVGQTGEFNTGIDDITRNVEGEEDWNTPHTETVTLTGGQTYDFAIAHREGGGGDFVHVEITPPAWTGIPAFRINPSDPDQDGLWSRSAPGAIDMTGTPITVTADSRLNAISEVSPAAFGDLTLHDGATLTTSGADMTFTGVSVAGPAGRRATLNMPNNVSTANYSDGGTATTLVKDGAGTLTLEPGGTINAAATTFEVNRSTLALTDSAGLSGPAQVVLDGATLKVTGPATTLAGMRGSVFFGIPRNESHLDLVGSAYQHNAGRVLTGDKAGTILIDGREDARHNTLVTGTIQNWNTFPNFDGNADDFVTAFSGVYTPRFSGNHTFRWSNDDRGLMFIDLDGDGVFQSTDRVGTYAWDSTATVNLVAGQPYTVIKMAQEYAGGQSVNWWLTEPGGSEARVNPTDGRGTWETLGAGPIDLRTTLIVDNGPADALMGSIFFGVPHDESHLNLDGASYQHNLTRVITGDKAGTILVDGREDPSRNTVISGTTQNWDSFPNFDGNADSFVTAFSGTFTPRVSGVHNFRWDNDDRGLTYIDLDGDGVFQNSERVAAYAWGANGNVTLTAGQPYTVIHMAQEFGGGQSVNWFFTEPGGSEVRVNPGDPAQAGLWGSPGLLATSTLDLATDSTANLQALVLKNGNLRITGGTHLSIEQASIDPGTGGAVGLVVETPTRLTGVAGFNGNNAAVTLTKSGPATLTIDRPGTGLQNADFRVNEGTLHAIGEEPFGPAGTTVTLAGGTFELEGSPVYTPGLLAGSHSGNTWTGGPNPGNLGVVLDPLGLIREGVQGNIRDTHWRAARADGGTGPDNTTLIYTGQIYLSGTTTFVEQNDDRTMLWVGGQQLINDGSWDNPVSAVYNPPGGPGWYDFEVRFSNGGGGYGFFGQGGWGAVDFGFGIAPGAVAGTNPLDYSYPQDPGDASMFRIVETGPIDAPEVNIGVDGGGTLRLTTATTAALGNLTFRGGTLNITGAPDGVTFTGGGVNPEAAAYTLNNPMDVTIDGPFDGGGAAANFTKTGAGRLTLAQGTVNHGGVSVDVQQGRLVAGGPMQVANLMIGGAASVDSGMNDIRITDGGRLAYKDGTMTISGAGADFAVGGSDIANDPDRLVVMGGTVTVTGPRAIPTNGLVGKWTFDDDTVNDSSGNNYHGTPVGSVAFSTDTGIGSGKSLDLTGGNHYVFVDTGGSQDVFDGGGAMTVAAWVKGWPGTWSPFVSKHGEPNGWQMRRHGGSASIDWTTRGVGANNGDFPSVSTAVSDGQWHHIAMTYDGSAKRIYVDGALDNTQVAGGTIAPSNEMLTFGARNTGPGAFGNFFNGLLDAIYFYDRALDDGDVLALFSNATVPPPLYLPDTDVTVTANATLLADSPSTATFGNLSLTGAGVNLTLDGAPGGFTFRNVAGGNSITLAEPGNTLTVTGVLDPGGDPTDPAAGVNADFLLAGNLTLDSGAAYRWEAGAAASGDWPDSVHVGGDLTLTDWTLAIVDPWRDGLSWDPLPLFLGFDSVTWDPELVAFDFSEAPGWLGAFNPDLMSVRHLLSGPRGEGLYLFVPEPSSLLLLAFGALALLLRRRRNVR